MNPRRRELVEIATRLLASGTCDGMKAAVRDALALVEAIESVAGEEQALERFDASSFVLAPNGEFDLVCVEFDEPSGRWVADDETIPVVGFAHTENGLEPVVYEMFFDEGEGNRKPEFHDYHKEKYGRLLPFSESWNADRSGRWVLRRNGKFLDWNLDDWKPAPTHGRKGERA